MKRQRKIRNGLLLLSFWGHFLAASAHADVRVSGFSNFAFGEWSGSGDLQSNDNLCVYNSVNGNYQITATGDGAGNAFTLATTGDAVAYQVYWNDNMGTVGNVELSTGSPLTGQTGANTSDIDCSGSSNANLEIIISEANLFSGIPGSYSGTLTIVVEPE